MKERIEILDGSTAEDEVHARELRTSNPLVTRLRSGKNCAEGGGKCRMMEARSGCECAQAADEIERLTADRDEWKGRAGQLSDEREELEAERDWLRQIVRDFVQYAGGMEYDDWRMFVQRAEEALAVQNDARTTTVDSGTVSELNP